jgi:CheY-like chemotaxis protein
MGGLNAMENLQVSPYRAIPVVLITADPSTDILLRASKMGFAGVMKKPVTEEQLLKMVAQQLERRQTGPILTSQA